MTNDFLCSLVAIFGEFGQQSNNALSCNDHTATLQTKKMFPCTLMESKAGHSKHIFIKYFSFTFYYLVWTLAHGRKMIIWENVEHVFMLLIILIGLIWISKFRYVQDPLNYHKIALKASITFAAPYTMTFTNSKRFKWWHIRLTNCLRGTLDTDSYWNKCDASELFHWSQDRIGTVTTWLQPALRMGFSLELNLPDLTRQQCIKVPPGGVLY